MSEQKLLAILALTDIGLTLAKEATKYIGNDKFGLCENYDKYHSIAR
ncbi:MAG: hypothetical protein MRQ09_05515 [Candidatus Midichloria sp.]|nr:hypothetical protein [Candidatus Midichloria sp.]